MKLGSLIVSMSWWNLRNGGVPFVYGKALATRSTEVWLHLQRLQVVTHSCGSPFGKAMCSEHSWWTQNRQESCAMSKLQSVRGLYQWVSQGNMFGQVCEISWSGLWESRHPWASSSSIHRFRRRSSRTWSSCSVRAWHRQRGRNGGGPAVGVASQAEETSVTQRVGDWAGQASRVVG